MKLTLLQDLIAKSSEKSTSSPAEHLSTPDVSHDPVKEHNDEFMLYNFPGMLTESSQSYQEIVDDLKQLKQTNRTAYDKIMNWD